MSAEEEEWVKIQAAGKETSQGDHLHFFHVTCTVLGEQLLTVEVGNKPSTSLPVPAVSSAKTRFKLSLFINWFSFTDMIDGFFMHYSVQ